MTPFRIGLVGCGGIARAHADAFAAAGARIA
jgi:predicted dehydrogenase